MDYQSLEKHLVAGRIDELVIGRQINGNTDIIAIYKYREDGYGPHINCWSCLGATVNSIKLGNNGMFLEDGEWVFGEFGYFAAFRDEYDQDWLADTNRICWKSLEQW